MTKHIFVSVGEASGDLLGSNLARTLLSHDPSLTIVGMGGTHMQQAGVELIEDISKMGVVGGLELIKHLKDIYHIKNKIKNYLKKTPPNLLVLIDYPGFNLYIASIAKQLDIKVLFYVSPQIWAWRYGRIKKIRRFVDHMAVLYRFEEALYTKEHIPVTFVGHPLKNIAKATLSKAACYTTLQLDPEKPLITLFPGSRKQEVEVLLPIILKTKMLIQQSLPHVQFALPIASTLGKEYFKHKLPDDITIIENNTYNLLSITDAAIAVSGTATLEIGLMNVPLLVIYKINPISYWLALCIIRKKPQLGLCNIIAQTQVAKEFIQYDATPENIANETLKLLQDKSYRADIQHKLQRIKDELGEGDPAENVAAVVLNML